MGPGLRRVTAYAFVDGAYLRHELPKLVKDWRIDPAVLKRKLRDLFYSGRGGQVGIERMAWFDAVKDDVAEGDAAIVQAYLDTVGLSDDITVAEGLVRGQGKRRRQKGVDVLLAVDALTGAFRGRYEVAIIVTGDGDFAPLVHAIRDAGPMVFVAGFAASSSRQLGLAADRFVALPTPDLDDQAWLPISTTRAE
jgi:uncharacterized LabA/DUF88 family protein